MCWLPAFPELNDVLVALSSSQLDEAHFVALFLIQSRFPHTYRCFSSFPKQLLELKSSVTVGFWKNPNYNII